MSGLFALWAAILRVLKSNKSHNCTLLRGESSSLAHFAWVCESLEVMILFFVRIIIFNNNTTPYTLLGTVSNGFGPGLEHPTLPVCHVSVGGSGLGLNSKAQQVQGLPWTLNFPGNLLLDQYYG